MSPRPKQATYAQAAYRTTDAQNAPPEGPPAHRPGQVWEGELLAGRYRVSEQLGAGGMESVYLARDERLDTEVVVKVPRAALLEDAEFARRFDREIRALV